MDTTGMGVGATTMHDQQIVMVAERAVTQLINDLRGELGVKFAELQTLIDGNRSDMEEGISDLSAAMTDAFKQNNASLRNEIKAIKGDFAQEFEIKLENKFKQLEENVNKYLASELSGKDEKVNKQIEELEKNINATLENIKENGVRTNGHQNRERGSGDDWNGKGGKYGFEREYKLEAVDRWTESNPAAFKAFKLKAERYFMSAKPYYADSIKILMAYVQGKEKVINLKETDDQGELVHKNILDQVWFKFVQHRLLHF